MTVAEGFVQNVWTFGGTVPGPGASGSRSATPSAIHLKNPATSQVPHSVDFHSSLVAWNDEMTSINPGEEKLYEFKAEYAGVWMYHCGTSPALHHIANGMYGMMIVEPTRGPRPRRPGVRLRPERVVPRAAGRAGLAREGRRRRARPRLRHLQRRRQPVPRQPDRRSRPAKRVRVFVLDAGPSIDSSFHIVGTIFDRVIKEGVELEVGNDGSWGSPGRGPVARPRARSSSSRWPRTASTRS